MLKIISGGQTGADLAGLWAASFLGLQTGGTAPKGFKTLLGSKPSLASFGLVEHESADYQPRTVQNIKDADVTLVFARQLASPGTKLTISQATKLKKPVLLIPDARPLNESITFFWIQELLYQTKATEARNALIDAYSANPNLVINVAGNATKRSCPDIFDFTFIGLSLLLATVLAYPEREDLNLEAISQVAAKLRDVYP